MVLHHSRLVKQIRLFHQKQKEDNQYKHMILKSSDNNNFAPCPEYSGICKVIDTTELTEYNTEYGIKEQFRIIFEINEKRENGNYWTVASKPLTPSLHEKASLRKFVEKILNRPLTKEELRNGFEIESVIGKYCNIVVEQIKSGDKTFSNITYIGKAKSTDTWNSDYVRLSERKYKNTDGLKNLKKLQKGDKDLEVTTEDLQMDAEIDAF